MRKLTVSLLAVLLFAATGFAQTTAPKVKVLLLGTFHFDNPGLDVAKFESANVLSPKRQAEIQDVIARLKQLKPDKIFVEREPVWQSKLDSLLQHYKQGQWQPTANEIYQLGFRLAKEVPAATLHAVDYQGAQFPFDSLMKVAQAEKQIQLLQLIQTSVKSIEDSFNQQLKTASIREMLIRHNSSPLYTDAAVGLYLELLKAGGKDNHVGSYLTSEWWRRNMIIYENILKCLDGGEKTIIVLFGSAHTALLREFMKYNPAIELLDVALVLQ